MAEDNYLLVEIYLVFLRSLGGMFLFVVSPASIYLFSTLPPILKYNQDIPDIKTEDKDGNFFIHYDQLRAQRTKVQDALGAWCDVVVLLC